MRAFAAAWGDEQILQQAVAQLPWGHITVLLDRLDDHELRDWYAANAAAHGWSRNVLDHQIRSAAHTRLEAAPTNFADVLPSGDSDLAQQITKDPYVLDFLAIDGDAKERHLEQALVDRIIDTLRELGEGFAFVGRQVHFDVDGDDFFVDLLFFHVEQLRYVVVELKTGKFKPEYLGQLGFSTSHSSTTRCAAPSTPTLLACSWSRTRTTPSSGTPSELTRPRSVSPATTCFPPRSEQPCPQKPTSPPLCGRTQVSEAGKRSGAHRAGATLARWRIMSGTPGRNTWGSTSARA
jgi:predicted nuclease of restriction endonuclease-like (RecB) superfamily